MLELIENILPNLATNFTPQASVNVDCLSLESASQHAADKVST